MRKLTDWLDSYLIFTDNSEPPEVFKIWTAMSVLAAALERKCYMVWEKNIYPNLYVVVIGPSGEARKGTAVGPGLELLEDLGIQLVAESITREGLIRRMKKSNTTISDPTTETPIVHASITIYSPELMVFIGDGKDKIISDLTDWYDCRTKWTYETKHQGIDDIQGVWINLLGATTPALMGSSLAGNAVGGGLLSRMILVYGDDSMCKVIVDPRFTKEELDLRAELRSDLEEINMLTGCFKVTDDYFDSYAEWYTEFRASQSNKEYCLGPYFARRPTHLRKVSMMMSISRSSEMILRVEDLVRADELLTRTERLMPQAFQTVGRVETTEFIKPVQTYIALQKKVTAKDLLARFYRDLTEIELRGILITLHAQKVVTLEKKMVGDVVTTVVTYIGKLKGEYDDI